MSFATPQNIGTIVKATTQFPITHSQWTLNKIHYCQATNAIRARFKNESIGMIAGVIKIDFVLKTNMEFSEILDNVNLDKIMFSESFTTLAEAFKWVIE